MEQFELLYEFIRIDEYIDYLTDEIEFSIRYHTLKLAIKEIDETGGLGSEIDVIYNPLEYSKDALYRFYDKLIRAKNIYDELIKNGINNNTILSSYLLDYAKKLLHEKDYHKLPIVLEKAMNLGNIEATYITGVSYFYGINGFKKSMGEGLNNLFIASKNEYVGAIEELIDIYFNYDNLIDIDDIIKYAKIGKKLKSDKCINALKIGFKK